MKVLNIGSSAIETTSETEVALTEGMQIDFNSTVECGGGYAGNVAYLLSKWGVESYIASMLGSDEAGTKIKKEFEAIGTKVDMLETSFEKPTSRTVIVVNKNTRNGTVLNFPSNANLKKFSFMIDPDIIFSDGTDYNATISAFDKYPKVMKIVSLSVATKESLDLAKFATYIVLNHRTAEYITNRKVDYNDSSSLVNIYNIIKQKYVKSEIIITLGERGCLYSVNANVKIMPPIKADIIDNYGCGAIFTGAFLYAMGRNFGMEKSIAYANIAASLSVGKISARNSIPSLTDVSTYYDSKFGAQNNPNNMQNQDVNMNTNANPNVAPTQTPNTNYQQVVNQNVQGQAQVQGVVNDNSQNA